MNDIELIKKKVSTTPCLSGGSNFKTHTLKKTNFGFIYKPSIGGILFSLLFVGIGFLFLASSIYIGITSEVNLAIGFAAIFGLVFFSIGLFVLLHFLKPRVFNKSSNYYYKSFKKNINRNTKNAIPLNRIVALQIIGETIKGENSSYNSFEINLVLSDATRLNVIDHGNLKMVIADSEILSAFLDVPIWHIESSKT